MKQNKAIETVISAFKPNELILASRLFHEQLSDRVSETAFYKTLERLCKAGKLSKISKGTYCIPKKSAFGIVPPSDREIISAFTKNSTGTVIGYALYNHLGLTTQIPRTTEVFSSSLETQTKRIRNVLIRYSPLQFSEDITKMIQSMDVLQNVKCIQDINYSMLIQYCKGIAETYDQAVFDEVISKQKYFKSTIAFLKEILDYYGRENSLNKYLSALSTYTYPKMEELNAASQLPQ